MTGKTMWCGILVLLSAKLFAADPVTVLEQGFEDTAFFGKLSVNGYTMMSPQLGGYWGVFGADQAVSISADQAAVGKNSLKVTRMEKAQTLGLAVPKKPVPADSDAEIEIWAYRPNGSELTFAIRGVDEATKKPVEIAALATGESGTLMVRTGSTPRWQRSGYKLTPDSWTRITAAFDRANRKCTFKAELEGKTVDLAVLDLAGEPRSIASLTFGAAPAKPGAAVYFDEVKITVPGK